MQEHDEVPPTPEEIAAFREILDSEDQRNNSPYDGLLGCLPEWVPGAIHRRFESLRNNLLNWRHNGESTPTPDQLMRWIDQQTRLTQMASGTYTQQEYVPLELMQNISELAKIRWTVELGPENGLPQFTDDRIARQVTLGNKFTNGRKPGTGGPIRNAIAEILNENHDMKNPELWQEVTAKPPRGWIAYDNRQGKYFEGPTVDDHMGQRRFFTVCGEERKKLKQ